MGRMIDASVLQEEYKRQHDGKRLLLIDVAPTVDAVPVVHGWWKRHYCDDGLSDGWQCSVCGEWYYFGENKPNFCPNCGTKMDGDNEQDKKS